jgi:hypothetical protein
MFRVQVRRLSIILPYDQLPESMDHEENNYECVSFLSGFAWAMAVGLLVLSLALGDATLIHEAARRLQSSHMTA